MFQKKALLTPAPALRAMLCFQVFFFFFFSSHLERWVFSVINYIFFPFVANDVFQFIWFLKSSVSNLLERFLGRLLPLCIEEEKKAVNSLTHFPELWLIQPSWVCLSLRSFPQRINFTVTSKTLSRCFHISFSSIASQWIVQLCRLSSGILLASTRSIIKICVVHIYPHLDLFISRG